MRLNKAACEEILCSESYVLGNVHVNIFHLAARYGFPLKVYACISITLAIVCKCVLGCLK